MIASKRVLAIIPARGGSKGVPRKNIRKVAGKPLIAWTIEAAKNSRHIDRLVLSSDDAEIIEVARTWECEAPFVRPAELAQDDTPGIDPVLHVLGELPGYDYVVLLQPTSPLRNAGDIDGGIEMCHGGRAPACVSVVESAQNPYWMYSIDGYRHLLPLMKDEGFSRRQDLPKFYVLNGAVYVADCRWLAQSRTFLAPETLAYEMPAARSLDIDDEVDFAALDAVLCKSSIDTAIPGQPGEK